MHNRNELQAFFEKLLKSRNVYFQPPASIKIKYPAIIYSLADLPTRSADDLPYVHGHVYEVTFVHDYPDDPLTETLALTPRCRFNRRFVTDNLYHDVYTLYY